MLLKDALNKDYPVNYIHYDLSQKEINTYMSYWNYGMSKQGQYDNLALKIFDEKLKAKFGNSNTYEAQYISFIQHLKNNGLQQAVNFSMQALPPLSYKTGSTFTLQRINNSITEFAKTAKHMNQWLAKLIALVERSEDAIEAMSIDPKLKTMAKNILPQMNTFTVDSISIENKQTILSSYKSLIRQLENFGTIDSSSLREINPTINSPVNSLLRQMHVTGGYISEYIAEHAFSEKKIAQLLQGQGYKVTHTGDASTGVLSTNTSDFMVTITDQTGLLSLNLPDFFSAGISWKRGIENKRWKNRNINIKSSSLGKLWSIVEGQHLTTRHRNSFYNLYAGYNQPQNDGVKFSQNQFNLMNNMVSQALLVTALAGDLDQDFAFLMVYNNKIFSIRDLIKQASFNTRGRMLEIVFNPPGNLNQQQKNIKNIKINKRNDMRKALSRSEGLVKTINDIKLNFQFRLSLNKAI